MVNYQDSLMLNSLKYTPTDISSSLKAFRNTIREVINLEKELNGEVDLWQEAYQ